jgi:uncharacterized protein
MKIEETFVVNAPRERVWPLITDPKLLATCVPGCESVDILSPDRYLGKVTIGIGPIKASFNVEVTITEQEAPSYVLCVSRGEENSRASQVSAENVLRLSDRGDGTTEVYYASDIQVVGRLGKFGLGIMKKKAKSLGDEFARAFKARAEDRVAV